VARRDQILTLDAQFGAEPPRQWRLEVDPAADAAVQRRDRWLSPRT